MTELRSEPTFDDTPGRPPARPRRKRSSWPAVTILLVAAVLAAAWLWSSGMWPLQRGPEESPPPAAAPAATTPPAATSYPPPTDAEPRPAQGNEVETALADAFGRDAVLRFLATADFPRRVAATVDNLGRDFAPTSVWPVQPIGGRFSVSGPSGAEHIDAANAARYRPLVGFLASLDAQTVVDLYTRLYPVLQYAYRQLGFGDRSFHERVIAVVDLLLATPEPQEPIAVMLTDVQGPVAPTEPWTRYEFADPQLQALGAGQKILLRVGPENRARLKAKLREVRALLVQPAGAQRR